jgi:hypothetical protein
MERRMKKAELRIKTFVRHALICFFILYSSFGLSVRGQDRPTDYQVKAAFLEKFGKFIEWPPQAFPAPDAPLIIGIFGEEGREQAPFRDTLETLAAGDTINGHPVQVRQIKALPDLKSCHILYIPAASRAQQREILDTLSPNSQTPYPILTVGDSPDFLAAGGMIQFVIENQQVHFEIRNAAARAAALKISSKLLILAKKSG